MNPELFPILDNSIPVKLLLGTNPLRVYPWNRAPQSPRYPYVTYGLYNGVPENYLDTVPDIDNKGTQVNVYAKTAESCEDCYNAIRNAIEPNAHMTGFSSPDLDPDTNLFIARLEFDFWETR